MASELDNLLDDERVAHCMIDADAARASAPKWFSTRIVIVSLEVGEVGATITAPNAADDENSVRSRTKILRFIDTDCDIMNTYHDIMMPMRRIPIPLDEETYTILKRRAFEENRSVASLVRESVSKFIAARSEMTIDDFPFVGSGRSKQSSGPPVSEDHDRVLADAYRPRRRK